MTLVVYLLCLIIIINIVISKNTIDTIFTPSIQYQITQSTTQNYSSFKIAKKSQLLFIIIEKSIIQIIDEKNDHKIILESNIGVEINDNFLITSNGKYGILFEKNILYIYENNLKQLTKIYTDDKNEQQIQALSFNKKQNKIFICRSKGNLEVIYLNTLEKIINKNLQELNCLNIAISEDESLLVVSDSLKGTYIYKLDILQNQILLQLITFCTQITFFKFSLVINDTYLVGLDNKYGISIFEIGQLKNMQLKNDFISTQLNPIVQNWQVFDSQMAYTNIIEIQQEGLFLYIGSKYEGIIIIDIQDKQNPKLFQIIKYNTEDILQIQVSLDNNYLFLANKQNIVIFKREKAILLQDYPNFYNKHISLLSKINETPYSWRSKLVQDDSYLLVSCYDQGLMITQVNQENIEQPLSIVSSIKQDSISYVDSFMLICSNKYLIIPYQDIIASILEVYDISDLKKPTHIQNIESVSSQYVFGMSKNYEETLFACEADFLLLIFQVSCNEQQVINKISEYSYPSFIQTAANDVLLLNGYNYIILLFRSSHILLIDISNLQKPQLANKLEILGGEHIIQSIYYKYYCFIADGLEGIQIMDLQQLPNIIYIQKINIKGYVNYISLIQNDKFIIASQLSGGQVSLIDIRNINKPKQISTLQYKSENSASTSIAQDVKQLFILNTNGIRIIPLLAHIIFHYEIQEIIRLDSGSIIYNRISDLSEPFLVGQEIQISLSQLYLQKGSQVTNVYFVEEGRLKKIPNWIEFDKNKSQVIIYAKRESLINSQENSEYEQITDKQNSSTLQSIVFETKLPIYENSFYYKDSETNKEIIDLNTSKQIFRTYREIGVINQIYQLSSAYAGNEEIYVPYVQGVEMEDNIQKYISFILQNSLVYSPVEFMVQNSLKVNILNSSINIKSHSKTAYIQLKINNFEGKFFQKSYLGVTTIISDKQDQIKLEGQIQKLNDILSQKIELYIDRKLVDEDKITSFLIINDGINNEYQKTLNFEQLQSFVQFKQDISISKNNELQSQIERQFEDQKIDIEAQTFIEFSFNTYENVNFTDLILYAYLIKSDDDSELILNQYQNIQFLPQQFKFLLKTTYPDFRKQFCFNINATDTYSWVENSFCVTASGISFYIISTILLQVGGPIFFVFGLSKSWHKIFNLLFYQDNIICTKQIREHQKFVHKFIIINDSYKIGSLLFQNFLKELQEKEKKLQLSYRESIQRKSSCLNQLNKQQQSKSSLLNSWQIQDKYKNKSSNNFNKKAKQLILNTLTSLKKIKTVDFNNQSLLFKYYQYNEANTKDLITDIVSSNKTIQFEDKIIQIETLFFELNDTGSILFNCIKGLLIKEILNQYKKSYLVYEYIKKYIILQENYTKYNWQSLLTETIHFEKKKKYNQEQIIPIINFKDEELIKILDPLLSKKDKSQQILNNLSINYIEECLDINISLIKNTLCEDAIGIIKPNASSLYPNYGESIHIHEHQIKQIKSYISNPHQSNKGIQRFFKPSFLPIILKENQNLPNWIEIKFEKQLITLIGTPPSTMNKESIKIQLFNNKGCIIRELNLQYKINIEQQQLDFKEECMTTSKLIDNKQSQFTSRYFKNTLDFEDKDQGYEQNTLELFTLDSIQGNRQLQERKKKSIFNLNKYSKNDKTYISDQIFSSTSRRTLKSQNLLNQSFNNIDNTIYNSPL